ncbi:MAG: alpha/beta hydrolase-fold protein [Anaerolineales bacterium]|jgi:predicted alpha/beta superfamily hydrolase|nr:alpha/beta hydrolase-fold protein [Anaerolineales bacterium]
MAGKPNTQGNGSIQRHARFESAHVESRHIDVWMPPGYHEDKERYPVLYMHDGQNLFDPILAYGNVDWGVDEAVSRLIATRGLHGAIVVGIWNSDFRWQEYMPAKPLQGPAMKRVRADFVDFAGGPALADAYLKFIVDELKPVIDSRYRTLADQANTFVLGSSMGALVSLYAISEYPAVFGGAGCISSHWPAGGDLLVDAMAARLPEPASHKLYFDFGSETLDASYEPFQRRMDEHLRNAGYQEGRNWITRKFEGADHSEASWRERIDIPLTFLLSPE